MKTNFIFTVSTRIVGSKREEKVTLDLPDGYDVENDPRLIINQFFEDWVWETISADWYEDNQSNT